VRAEWTALVDAVTQSSVEAQPAVHPALVAHLASEAPLPTSPIDPNRRLLLFFRRRVWGWARGAFTLVMRAAQQRRVKASSRPPVPVSPQSGLTVQLPSAPALPSGLGPAVPMLGTVSRPAGDRTDASSADLLLAARSGPGRQLAQLPSSNRHPRSDQAAFGR